MGIHTRHTVARHPAPQPVPARFTVGRDHHGWWIVEDRLERVGGIFTSEDAAMHFALEECDRDRAAIRCSKRPLRARL